MISLLISLVLGFLTFLSVITALILHIFAMPYIFFVKFFYNHELKALACSNMINFVFSREELKKEFDRVNSVFEKDSKK